MANELHSLSILLQNRLFRTPDYQRGYAWKREQLADFWDDLMNLQEDRYHVQPPRNRGRLRCVRRL